MTAYVFFTGGVVSALGKGLTSAATAAVLQARGFTTRIRKLDPYLNVDPGTMNPIEHGEVFVTDDGSETDLDLGHYERFTGVPSTGADSISAGRIYTNVLRKEREGKFLGRTIQIVPHITNEIQDFLREGEGDVDFMICEIGGTVGDIEGMPFYEAIRQFSIEDPDRKSVFVHLTFVPYLQSSGENKTKPTQHSIQELRSIGISPNIVICRTEQGITESDRNKIALFGSVKRQNVIQLKDLDSIYHLPLVCHAQGLDSAIIEAAGITDAPDADLSEWIDLDERSKHAEGSVKIAVVGKYVELEDAYKSVKEALIHAGIENQVNVDISFVDSELLEDEDYEIDLVNFHGILVPGGFGERGTKGMIEAARVAREKKIPYLGICFGMHMAVLDAQRNILGNQAAGSEEFDEGKADPEFEHYIYHMKEWVSGNQIVERKIDDEKGGTMRLGAFETVLKPGSLAAKLYGQETVSERHRHRYEVNSKYLESIVASGLVMTGTSPDGLLPEVLERTDHPWFLGVQYHPELKSSPLKPHPIFVGFIEAAIDMERIL